MFYLDDLKIHLELKEYLWVLVVIPHTRVKEQTINWETNVVCLLLLFIFKSKSNIRSIPVHYLVMISHLRIVPL